MSRLPDHTAEPPWYRQFWPWFLILLPGSVVVAAVATLVIANRGADDLVATDYYKEGLAINERLGREQLAAELGVSASFRLDGDSVRIQLSAPDYPPELTLRLSHPLESDRDFELAVMSLSQGEYSAPLPQPVAERWHWTLQSSQQSGWRLSGVLGSADFQNDSGY